MQAFQAFWIRHYCPRFKEVTRHVITCLRKGKYHVECNRCGHQEWVNQAVIDQFEKEIVSTVKPLESATIDRHQQILGKLKNASFIDPWKEASQ